MASTPLVQCLTDFSIRIQSGTLRRLMLTHQLSGHCTSRSGCLAISHQRSLMSLLKKRFEMASEERLLAYLEADRQQGSAQWTKGDLLLDLEDESLMEFSQHVNDSYQQLRNYKWVSSCYPVSVRTDTLSWTHHERIAARDDREEWLKKAEENRWSV